MGIEIATKMLNDAAAAIAGRQKAYGPPDKNFKVIAELWSAYLRGRYGELATLDLDESDVAVMSGLIKTARLAETPWHEDSWIDMAGYAACGRQVSAECQTENEPAWVPPDIDRTPNSWWTSSIDRDVHPAWHNGVAMPLPAGCEWPEDSAILKSALWGEAVFDAYSGLPVKGCKCVFCVNKREEWVETGKLPNT